MNIDARNPIIHKLIKDFLLKDIEHAETLYDFDNV